jgi:hypothetical protein
MIHRVIVTGLALAFATGVPPARAQGPVGAACACAGPDRVAVDLEVWRKQVMTAAEDHGALAPLLTRVGFRLEAFECSPAGRVTAVDVFPATFGAKRDADRIVQIRTSGCFVDRDFVVLTRSPDASWCIAKGDIDKGISGGGCSYDPPIIALVHLTSPRLHTIRVDASHGLSAVSDENPTERACYRTGFVQFWDVEPGRLVFRLEVPYGPITLTGGYPKDVQALDDMQKLRAYRLVGERYEAVHDK